MSSNIQVVVRVRPLNSRGISWIVARDINGDLEIALGAQCCIQMQGDQTILDAGEIPDPKTKDHPETSKSFTFDKSYWSFNREDPHYASQDVLFNDLGVSLLENAFQGFNNCIVAYGQTGSGKSYSMMGYGEEKGIIPRICMEIFNRKRLKASVDYQASVEVSYMEIYNEKVRDLLNPTNKGNLKVREHPALGPYVEDLSKLAVNSFEEIENLMDEGNKARTVAATKMNETSSRSHAVFTLTLSQVWHDAETNMDTEKVSRINLVDLAGSERANSTGAKGARLKEGAEINRSLSTLGRVIAALADQSSGGKKKKEILVPYRDSVLTWLLKDSLGGNSKTTIIAALSPALINYDETLSTLRYADSAKRIRNHAVVNEDPNAKVIRELKEELAALRSRYASGSVEDNFDMQVSPEMQVISFQTIDGTVRKVTKAEIAEQMETSEKLMKELNQTWEEKLLKTQIIQKEREKALEDLGISIEKGFIGLSTPKKMPHLVNLSDDPLLAECLVYNIRSGITRVGNVTSISEMEIRLSGSKIKSEHCHFDNLDGIVTLFPHEGANVMVNGLRCTQKRRLRSGYRIILGDFHIFRFNHPEEARAERSKVRHSISQSYSTMSPLRNVITEHDIDSDSPQRTSPPNSDVDPSVQPDWFFARREAALSMLGPNSNINTLKDDELDQLFEDLQRVRTLRKRRSDSRLDSLADDDDSVTSSHALRENYRSQSTYDEFSLETTITLPIFPDEELRNTDIERLQIAEKKDMFEQLIDMREEMERNLEEQRLEFEARLEDINKGQLPRLTVREKEIARPIATKWRKICTVRIAEILFEEAVFLKEAQILANQLRQRLSFQFAISEGRVPVSRFDQDIICSEIDDCIRNECCVLVRVMDYRKNSIYVWSIAQLHGWIDKMRKMRQYKDRPEYAQHFKSEFSAFERSTPAFTLVGYTDIPILLPLENSHDMRLPLISPFTYQVVAMVELSIVPAITIVSQSTLQDMQKTQICTIDLSISKIYGLIPNEFEEVHMQCYLRSLTNSYSDFVIASSSSSARKGALDSIRFESRHTIQAMVEDTGRFDTRTLRLALFARVKNLHLEKLSSWDEMRQGNGLPNPSDEERRPESCYQKEEGHDVMARLEIKELATNGKYKSTNVITSNQADDGVFYLHQGTQRRLALTLSHQSGLQFPINDLINLSIGHIRLWDTKGRRSRCTEQVESINLNSISPISVKYSSDGSMAAIIIIGWDSSVHGSPYLDRATNSGEKVILTLSWVAVSEKVSKPINFNLDFAVHIRPRGGHSPSGLSRFISSSRRLRSSTYLYRVILKPPPVIFIEDLWRKNTGDERLNGDEVLNDWKPRGTSLIEDYLEFRKKASFAILTEFTRQHLCRITLPETPVEERDILVQRCVRIWKSFVRRQRAQTIMERPKSSGASTIQSPRTAVPPLISRPNGIAHLVSKSRKVSLSGYLLMPDEIRESWVKRWLVLRRPYLYIYDTKAETNIQFMINIESARTDNRRELETILEKVNVFAVYTANNSYFFKAETHQGMNIWIDLLSYGF
ncbi:Kinesin-like protein unc-104 [Neolecta irregularis DAH-3]|uniref:Kinesin-like protein unc-104 n=1 Tax=Neolecta irregularis (strain DAH-3) TaxID=1198029 RepID=A0A1U7LV52_NEOID|nr:Kinesin-like protein unc-104 [Neolecta irregularis DAH-3]|eukprot:OLL26550.1 Kinesin-like protein unc-104 [Neolecta irregularis DAH-3]